MFIIILRMINVKIEDFKTPYSAVGGITRIAENTVAADNLKVGEVRMLSEILKFNSDETLEIVYMFGREFEAGLKLEGTAVVGLTNQRVFKLEKGNVEYSLIKDIDKVSKQSNGIFKWDKIMCHMKDGKIETYGIHRSTTCEYFCMYINKLMPKKSK